MSDLIHETGFLRWAYSDLVEWCLGRDANPDELRPERALELINGMDQTRAAALLYAHHVTASIAEGARLLDELKGWLLAGRRPRSMSEVVQAAGYIPEEFMRQCGVDPVTRRRVDVGK